MGVCHGYGTLQACLRAVRLISGNFGSGAAAWRYVKVALRCDGDKRTRDGERACIIGLPGFLQVTT